MRMLFLTILFCMLSFSGLAITIINKSNVSVCFRLTKDEHVLFIKIKPEEVVALEEEEQNKLSIQGIGGGSSLYRFQELGDKKIEPFFRNDSFKKIYFIISTAGKIRPLSSYKTMIIKNADPNVYDGLSMELYTSTEQKFYDVFDISSIKCNLI